MASRPAPSQPDRRSTPPYGYVECWYCSPDGLSTAEARRDWERKRSDPRLARYLRLAEPEAVDGAP